MKFCLGLVSFGGSTALAGPTLTELVNFSGSNGESPEGSVIADPQGNLYGTTSGNGGYGTVFKVAAGTHSLSTLATFNGSNGEDSVAGLIVDASGNLYGTAEYGGALGTPDNRGSGTVFEVAAGTSTISTLVKFSYSNGAYPTGNLIADASGNLYGTTSGGGSFQRGTVFKIAAGTNKLSTLVTFNGSNGATPAAGLIADASGNLYGTTKYGGSSFGSNNNAYGTVFKIAIGTSTLSTLASFNYYNGELPVGSLLTDAAGDLYGTTTEGGSYGSVFKIAAGTSTITYLATFNYNNGATPDAGLIADAAGNLYGTTEYGGTSGLGTVFKLASGTNILTALYSFSGNNGEFPVAGLTVDASGNLYGTTSGGGSASDGTVFELSGTGFAVPEPGSLSLIGIASIAMLRRRRRALTKH